MVAGKRRTHNHSHVAVRPSHLRSTCTELKLTTAALVRDSLYFDTALTNRAMEATNINNVLRKNNSGALGET